MKNHPELVNELKINKLFNSILDSIEDGIIIFDEEGNVIWQHKAKNLLDIDPSKHNSEFYIEGKWLSPSVKTLTGEFNGSIVCFRDITAEKEWIQQVISLQTSIFQMKEGMILTDPTYKIIFANDIVCKRMGYSLSELRGKTPNIFHGPKTDKKKIEEIKSDLKTGKSVSAEVMNYSKDGKEYYIRFTASPVLDEKGNIINYIGINEDVTEKRLQEQDLLSNQIEKLSNIQDSIRKRISELDKSDN